MASANPPPQNAPFIGYENFEARDLRPYQLEMVEQSLKGNVVVSMDTGTGKTGVAIIRAKIALERNSPETRVWVLTPTKHLCQQQALAFSKGLLMYGCRSLCGIDGVEFWSEQRIWDSALLNMRVVVATPDVLYDALSHGFVKLGSICLLIFDEAHHATGKNSAYHRIMNHHYFKAKLNKSSPIPSILGLSASPSMTAHIIPNLKLLETRLDAIVVSPAIEKGSLTNHTFRPSLVKVPFGRSSNPFPPCLTELYYAVDNYAYDRDPYVRSLMARPDAPEIGPFLRGERKTDSYTELNSLFRDIHHIHTQLGSSSSVQHLERARESFRNTAKSYLVQGDIKFEELQHLIALIPKVLPVCPSPEESYRVDDELTSKAIVLLNELDKLYSPEFKGIIFVKQRSMTIALTELIRHHPLTQGRLRPAPIFGDSNHRQRKNLATLDGLKRSSDSLGLFRTGDVNLLVATPVLEEGIDVPDCNCVICFDIPPSLKSFIQRRGRSRMANSSFIVLDQEREKGEPSPIDWESIEAVMAEELVENTRDTVPESIDDTIEWGLKVLEDPSTGAIMNRDRALPSMYHFFSSLVSGFQPVHPSICVDENRSTVGMTYSARVKLPASSPLEEREVAGGEWTSIRKATMDAAFNVVSLLYKGGYLNNRFLPPLSAGTISRNRALTMRMYSTARPVVPWIRNPSASTYFGCMIEVTSSQKIPNLRPVRLLFPRQIYLPKPITCTFSDTLSFTVSCTQTGPISVSKARLKKLREQTFHLLDHTRPLLQDTRIDFGLLIDTLDDTEIPTTVKDTFLTFSEAQMKGVFDTWVVVRPSMSKRYLVNLSSMTSRVLGHEIPFLKGIHYLSLFQGPTLDKTRWLDLKECYFETTSLNHTLISLVYPWLANYVEEENRVRGLQKVLSDQGATVSYESLRTSVTLPQAQRIDITNQKDDNYQLLEYWGDRILKLMTVISLAKVHPTYGEGYLTGVLSCQLSNNVLATRTLQLGLDRFFIAKPISFRGWNPPYLVDSKLARLRPTVVPKIARRAPTPTLRKLDTVVASAAAGEAQQNALPKYSTKMLADIPEAMIGAAYEHGGFESAWSLIRWIYPRWKTESWSAVITGLINSRNPVDWTPDPKLTAMIGYQFKRPWLLLEAITCPSLIPLTKDIDVRGYDVMELIGDAVLDYLVVCEMTEHIAKYGTRVQLGEGEYTQILSSVCNADFLAFCVLGLRAVEERGVNPTVDESGKYVPAEVESKDVYLWSFLRHHDLEFSGKQIRAFERFKDIEGTVREQLFPPKKDEHIPSATTASPVYPWTTLMTSSFEKPLSDLFEAIVGAIYLDSGGNREACLPFLQNAGVLPVLHHILESGIDTLHPVSRLNNLIIPVTLTTEKEPAKEGDDFIHVFTTTIMAAGQVLASNVAGPTKISSQAAAATQLFAQIESGEFDLQKFATDKVTVEQGVKVVFDSLRSRQSFLRPTVPREDAGVVVIPDSLDEMEDVISTEAGKMVEVVDAGESTEELQDHENKISVKLGHGSTENSEDSSSLANVTPKAESTKKSKKAKAARVVGAWSVEAHQSNLTSGSALMSSLLSLSSPAAAEITNDTSDEVPIMETAEVSTTFLNDETAVLSQDEDGSSVCTMSTNPAPTKKQKVDILPLENASPVEGSNDGITGSRYDVPAASARLPGQSRFFSTQSYASPVAVHDLADVSLSWASMWESPVLTPTPEPVPFLIRPDIESDVGTGLVVSMAEVTVERFVQPPEPLLTFGEENHSPSWKNDVTPERGTSTPVVVNNSFSPCPPQASSTTSPLPSIRFPLMSRLSPSIPDHSPSISQPSPSISRPSSTPHLSPTIHQLSPSIPPMFPRIAPIRMPPCISLARNTSTAVRSISNSPNIPPSTPPPNLPRVQNLLNSSGSERSRPNSVSSTPTSMAMSPIPAVTTPSPRPVVSRLPLQLPFLNGLPYITPIRMPLFRTPPR